MNTRVYIGMLALMVGWSSACLPQRTTFDLLSADTDAVQPSDLLEDCGDTPEPRDTEDGLDTPDIPDGDDSSPTPPSTCYPSTAPSPIVFHQCGTVNCPLLAEANVLTSGWKDTWELFKLNVIYNYGCADESPGDVDLHELLGLEATTTITELAAYAIDIDFPHQPFASYSGTFLFVDNKVQQMCIETVVSEYFPDCFTVPALAYLEPYPGEERGILRVINIGIPEPPDLDLDSDPATTHLTLDMYFKRRATEQ